MSSRTTLLHAALTQSIIGACYEVYNELGWGYAEVVYAEALAVVLESHGIVHAREQVLQVWFRQRVIGVFRADLVVDNRIIVELKAQKPEVRRLIWTPNHQRLMND